MNWYLKCIKQYADFSGRARRQEYWMFVLINILFGIAAGIIDTIIGFNCVSYLYSLFVLIPSIAVCVRRLHDIGKSGYWILISFVPLVGAIILIVWACREGDGADNEYGPNPKVVVE